MKTPDRFYIKISVTLLVLLFLRCGGNMQKGQYAVNQTSSQSLANGRGMIQTVKGTKLDKDGNITGETIPLLYFLAVMPADKFNGGFGSSDNNKGNESEFVHTWFNKIDDGKTKFEFNIDYDRQKDYVNIYDYSLNRQDGNAFLIIFDKDMKASVRQFKGLNADNNNAVLEFFKAQDTSLKDLLIFIK